MQLEIWSGVEAAFRIEQVVNRGVDRCEFLQTSHSLEAQHRPFSSTQWQMGIFRSVVQPTTTNLLLCVADDLHRSTIWPQSIGHYFIRPTVPSHCFSQEFQGGFLVSGLCDKAFKHLTFVVDSPPKVKPLAVDLHEHLAEVPAPMTRLQPEMRLFLIPDANIRPNRCHSNGLLRDWHRHRVRGTNLPPCAAKEETGREKITARRMISGLVLKYLNGDRLLMAGR